MRLDILALDGKILLGTCGQRRLESLEEGRMLSLSNAVRIIDIERQLIGRERSLLVFEIEPVEIGNFVRLSRRFHVFGAASGQQKGAGHKSKGSQKANGEGCGFHYNRFIVNVG